LYARGYGVEKNLPVAVKWLNLAAIQRDPGAQYSLSTLYFTGEGVPQNMVESARLRREAAIRGHVQAQSDLGMMYYEGKGVEKNLQQAYYWLAVAGQQGDDVAQEQLKKVSAGLTPGQIKDAENQAKEWMAKAKKTWNNDPK
jgi:TPR repeat protein